MASKQARLSVTFMRNACHGLLLLPFGLSVAHSAYASGETAALGAALGQFFFVVIAAFTIAVALAAAFAPKFSYRSQLMVLMVFVAFATGAFALLFSWKSADIAFVLVVLGCVASLVHACIYHSVKALKRAWCRGAQQAVQRNGPASGGPAP